MRLQDCEGANGGSYFSMFCSTLSSGNHNMSVKIPGPLYKFNASSLKDRLVSLDMKVKIEFVSICIFPDCWRVRMTQISLVVESENDFPDL